MYIHIWVCSSFIELNIGISATYYQSNPSKGATFEYPQHGMAGGVQHVLNDLGARIGGQLLQVHDAGVVDQPSG